MHCFVAASERGAKEQHTSHWPMAPALLCFYWIFWDCTSNEFVVRFAFGEGLLFCDTFIGNYSATDENAVDWVEKALKNKIQFDSIQ